MAKKDIYLNLKIDADWMRRHQQKRIPTLGKNEKHYIVCALNSQMGKISPFTITVLCAHHASKDMSPVMSTFMQHMHESLPVVSSLS